MPAGVYNLASGVGRRVGDVLDALIERAGVDVTVEIDPERFRPTDRGVGDADAAAPGHGLDARHALRDHPRPRLQRRGAAARGA